MIDFRSAGTVAGDRSGHEQPGAESGDLGQCQRSRGRGVFNYAFSPALRSVQVRGYGVDGLVRAAAGQPQYPLRNGGCIAIFIATIPRRGLFSTPIAFTAPPWPVWNEPFRPFITWWPWPAAHSIRCAPYATFGTQALSDEVIAGPARSFRSPSGASRHDLLCRRP